VRELLREGNSVLDAALNAGLSGPGRLHDLCVTLEAASPGEMKNGGAGIRIDYGFSETPFGQALLAETPRGLCHLSFVDQDRDDARELLQSQWPNAKLHRNDSRAAELSDKIFARPDGNKPFQLRAFVRATPFQLRVWRALLQVPPGYLTSYGRIAERIGESRAARAVGTAVGANPIAFIIPCHRVIRETGALGHYHWDPIRKRAILGWEIAPRLSALPEATRIEATAA
jgi:AraC family transcriptional regulator of adaptative response/methylated-DNA-[protein]-cysteine methyltransferase